ncbi:MAG: TIGR02757 family protein, partial [Chlorobi bacterium]|nr:TIGR02757 family protein [Chlorobiota bacterium]
MSDYQLNEKQLRGKLDYHYKYFDASQISPDPLEFPRRFERKNDIEISAFVSAVFAFGGVLQIEKILSKIHSLFGKSPLRFVKQFERSKKISSDLYHRFYSSEDVKTFFLILNEIYSNNGSLKKLFLTGCDKNDLNLKDSISNFSKSILEIAENLSPLSDGVKFMFPNPYKGSACKRMNLFLRWMVRKDELDFGLWKEIPASKLLIPVDTHIARICRELGLTKRKNVSWKMAEEITENLKRFDADDPVKYDFAICHIG